MTEVLFDYDSICRIINCVAKVNCLLRWSRKKNSRKRIQRKIWVNKIVGGIWLGKMENNQSGENSLSMNIITLTFGRDQNDSPEKRDERLSRRRSFDKADISPIRRLFSSPVKSVIAISINLRTGCKGRREIVFPCKGKAVGTRYSGLVAQVSRRGIISEG